MLVDYDDVVEPEPGMRYRDRLGPWFDGAGTEIIPVGTEAVDLAVELVVGRFEVRSALPDLDAFTVEVTYPLLTDLIQQDWDRVVEGSDQGVLPGRGFLIAYEGAGAAIGRLAEDLLCDVVLERAVPVVCPGGTVLTAEDAAADGLCALPTTGPRSDDLVIYGDDQLTIVESKCTIGTWGRLRPMVRKAITAGYRSTFHGPPPELVGYRTRAEEIAGLVEAVKGWIDDGLDPGDIGIAARTNAALSTAESELRAAGVPARLLSDSKEPGSVAIGTMHRMKGMGFRAVAIIDAGANQIPLPAAVTQASVDELQHRHDLQRERCLLYVACTRARDTLRVSWIGDMTSVVGPAPSDSDL